METADTMRKRREDPAADLAQHPLLARDQGLTRELLEWATNALTEVLRTQEVQVLSTLSEKQALTRALKKLDHLWIHAYRRETFGTTEAEPRSPGELRP